MLKILRFNANIRFYSIKHATKKPIKYTDTINLPKTKFPNRLTAAKRDELERALVKNVLSGGYQYQEQHNKEPTFVLHDGPPYANGDLHMGHAVNKILKDITLRQHVAKGQKVHYVPGWDCHGLPIELKAMASPDGPKSGSNRDAISIRKMSRQFALAAIERQKSEFRAWGVLSNWDSESNVYLTFKPDFIVNQLQLFLDFYERGLVYRDLKPVYWSPSSKTALAEAELEYDANFVSPSVYVRFALSQLPAGVTVTNNSKVYALVWTTTPWTLPSNQAICYNSALEYAVVKLQHPTQSDNNNDLYLLATNLLADFENSTQMKCDIVQTLNGVALGKCSYQHPIFKAETALPFYSACHVQDTKGTGLVHTAPAHGPDDFLICLEKKVPVKCFVNKEGVYTSEAPDFLRGKAVLDEGDKLVLEQLSEDIVFAGKLTHAYPIDWRTKKPVIIRASEQWFINTEKLKERAGDEISKIEIYPRANAEASKKALATQVYKRPYWCISRQRVWGVPIPVFCQRSTGAVITNKILVNHICELIRKEGGVDFWWSKSPAEILPENLLKELNLNADDLVQGGDIFDIWFDSGSTWSSVLGGSKVADLYLEGYDQFTGWFQSSLLTSVAARNYAPYKALFVHGFTVDEKGLKMSKSLGNVISPKDITKKYGTDVLRWWVASHATQNMSITVSEKLMQQIADNVSKIRATLRYLKGAIGSNKSSKSEKEMFSSDMRTYLDKYLLSVLVDFEDEIQKSYNTYEYNRVIASIQNFVANEISAIYVHLMKDRLYCGDNVELENIRFTLTQCYELLCKALWPVTPFLIEESWSYYDPNSSFHQQNVKVNPAWKDEQSENVINAALEVKRLLNQQAGDTNTWTLSVDVACANNEKLSLLQKLHPTLNVALCDTELTEILQAGMVNLTTAHSSNSMDYVVSLQSLQTALCPRCRRFAVEADHCTCARCTKVLNSK